MYSRHWVALALCECSLPVLVISAPFAGCRSYHFVLIFLFFSVSDVRGYTPAALADQIHNLPGLAEQPTFNMFSGYLTVDPAKGRKIFYWYVESSRSPSTDPLIWWSNGGLCTTKT
jgi:hypothetical protein